MRAKKIGVAVPAIAAAAGLCAAGWSSRDVMAQDAQTIARWRTYSPPSDEEYAKKAEAHLLAEVKDTKAQIVSMNAEGPLLIACGWVDLGPGRGTTAFLVSGWPDHEYDNVSVPEVGGETRKDRIASLFNRQYTLVACSQRLPPRPAGAFVDTPAERQVAKLLPAGVSKRIWAVIQPPGEQVFVGVRIRKGGGLIITPGFRSREQVVAWLRSEGEALVEEAQGTGAAAMKRYGKCARKAAAEQCPDSGLDEVIELSPSPAWKRRASEVGSAR